MRTTLSVFGLIVILIAAAACGSGSGESGATAEPGSRATTERRFITSRATGQTYPIDIYLPALSAGSRATLPIVYALDGEWRFSELVSIAERTPLNVIIVAIGNQANRARDYVPPNSCTANGGGHVAFLEFIQSELIPTIEASIGGDRSRRALLGHSHGGAFVYYALFAQASGARHFSAYLASDASIHCMPSTVLGWEEAFNATGATLPVRLHVSFSDNLQNDAFAQQVNARRYVGLALEARRYSGGHVGMIPAAFADALVFAFAGPR